VKIQDVKRTVQAAEFVHVTLSNGPKYVTELQSDPAGSNTEERLQPHGDAPAVIYHDALLRGLLVVEYGGQLWLVPRQPGGWSARSPVTMTAVARQQRLTPARDVTAGWLGIDAGNGCEASTVASADGQP
jgi:hypothetical protein